MEREEQARVHTHTETESVLWFTAQMPATPGAKLAAGAPCRWVAETKSLDHHLLRPRHRSSKLQWKFSQLKQRALPWDVGIQSSRVG